MLLRQNRHASLERESPVHLLFAFSGVDVAKALLYLTLLSVHLALQRARIPIDQNVLKIKIAVFGVGRALTVAECP